MSDFAGNKHLKVAPWVAGRKPRTTVARLGSLLIIQDVRPAQPTSEIKACHTHNVLKQQGLCCCQLKYQLVYVQTSEVILLLTFCRVGLSFLSRNILEGSCIINLGLNVWMENWQVPFFWFNHSFPFHEKTTVYTGWSLRTMGFIFSILKASLTLLSQRRTYNYF